MKASLYHDSKTVPALLSAAHLNGTANGVTVDKLQAGVGDYTSVLFVVQTATITDGTHTFSVQDSDDGSAWAAAAAGDLLGTPPVVGAANDDVVYDFGYAGPKRYVRLVCVTSGATSGGVIGAVAVLSATAGWRR
jgi:hypothetical protein